MSRSNGSAAWKLVGWGTLLAFAMLIGFAVGTARAARDETADTMFRLRVRSALLAHLGIDALRVGVTARGTEVGLAGTVPRATTATLAEQVARSVSGVRAVDNQIRVAPPPVADGRTLLQRAAEKARREVADAVLETQVKMQLIEELGRSAFGIEVEAEDGMVCLSGTVPDQARHVLALVTADRSEGVTKVVDQLRVG